MKTASTDLVSFFGTAKQGLQFDLWTILLASTTVLRWTDADVDLQGCVRGPVITRDQVSWMRGIEVDQLRAQFAGPAVTVDGQPLPAFAAAGGFDAAYVTLERCYMDGGGTVRGQLNWFSGQVADVTPGRMGCELVIKSQLTQLQQQLPRNLYQPGCLNDLYDAACGVSKAAFTVAGTVSSIGGGYNPTLTIDLAGGVPSDFFPLGIVKFTSGANKGFGRTVQAQTSVTGTQVQLVFSRPFPFPVNVGDGVTGSAGCDKSMNLCGNRFNNLPRFRGTPFIPVPETVT